MKLFIDTETTGLPRRRNASYSDVENWPRLVQLAWVLVDPSGREISAVEHIIRPDGFSIPSDAAKIHGITTEKALIEGVSISQALGEFGEAVSVAEIVVAHNVEYDRPVLEAEHIRHGLRCDIGSKQLVCTKETSTHYCAIPGHYGYKWPTLNELHQKLFGESMREAHNALVDVRACMKCYFELIDRGVIAKDRPIRKKVEREAADSGNNHTQELIDEVIDLAEEHDWFDSEFVDSVAEQFENRGFLSEKQIAALENIRDMLKSR